MLVALSYACLFALRLGNAWKRLRRLSRRFLRVGRNDKMWRVFLDVMVFVCRTFGHCMEAPAADVLWIPPLRSE